MNNLPESPRWIDRIDTRPLAPISGAPCRALVVLNDTDRPVTGLAVLHAQFRTRTAPQPVVVRDGDGAIVASRLENAVIGEPDADGRRLWSFDLVFDAGTVPAHGYKTFAAAYEAGDAPDGFDDAPRLTAFETEVHDGDLPLTGPVPPPV